MNKRGVKVAVGMSGGVDSSVSALLLKQAGYDVVGLFMKLWHQPRIDRQSWLGRAQTGVETGDPCAVPAGRQGTAQNACCDDKALADAHLVAKKIGIPLYEVDARKEFKEAVTDYFIDEYKNIRTPNPCVVCNKKIKFGIPSILNYHRIAMSHIRGAGAIRKQNVRIKFNPKFKTCDWDLIPSKLNELMKKYNSFETKKGKDIKEVIDFASFFHNEFQRIHPFIDGNSRTSRLLMLHILRSYGIPVLDLPLGYFDLYMDLTKRSTERDDKAFSYLIEEIVFMNLRKLNSAI